MQPSTRSKRSKELQLSISRMDPFQRFPTSLWRLESWARGLNGAQRRSTALSPCDAVTWPRSCPHWELLRRHGRDSVCGWSGRALRKTPEIRRCLQADGDVWPEAFLTTSFMFLWHHNKQIYIYMDTDTKWYSEQMWTDLNTSSNPPLRQDLRSVSQLVAVVSGWSGRLQRILQCLERGYTAATTGNSYTTFADEREFIYVDIYLLANIYGYGSNLHIYIYTHGFISK